MVVIAPRSLGRLDLLAHAVLQVHFVDQEVADHPLGAIPSLGGGKPVNLDLEDVGLLEAIRRSVVDLDADFKMPRQPVQV